MLQTVKIRMTRMGTWRCWIDDVEIQHMTELKVDLVAGDFPEVLIRAIAFVDAEGEFEITEYRTREAITIEENAI